MALSITSAQPKVTVQELASVTGSAALDSVAGTITFLDAGVAATPTVTVTGGAGFLGSLTLGTVSYAAGSGSVGWNFSVADSALDFLSVGDVLTQNYTVTVRDSTGTTVTQLIQVQITGTNDTPTIVAAATTATGTIQEITPVTAATLTSTGTVSFHDADFKDSHTVTVAPVAGGAGFVGTLTATRGADSQNGATGTVAWTYSVVDSALAFLAPSQTVVQNYNVTVSDNHGASVVQVVSVTIHGVAEAPPVITSTAAAAAGTVNELPNVTGSTAIDASTGTLTFTDINVTDTHTVTAVPQAAGYLGTFSLGALTDSLNGTTGHFAWNFSVVDSALDFLAAGQTLIQKYNVTIDDHHGGTAVQVVTVTMVGTAEPSGAAIITSAAAAATGSVTELAGNAGSLSLDTAGNTLTYTDQVPLDHHTVTFSPQAAGYLGTFTAAQTVDATGGVVGSVPWSYSVADGALDFLAAGQTVVQSYNLTITSTLPNGTFNGATTQVITLTLHGTNDAPVITAAVTSGSVTELAGVTGSAALDATSGTITFTDLDLIDTHTATAVAQGLNYIGTLTPVLSTDSTGGVAGHVTWSFSAPDSALDFLSAGQSVVQSYTVTVDDGHGGTVAQVVNVTLTGTNDAPIITSTAAAATGAVTELAGVTGSAALDTTSGTLTFTDVDLADFHSVTAVAQGANYVGALNFVTVTEPTGLTAGSVGWNFSVTDGSLDFLAAGQTLVQNYNVTVNDGHGGTATQVVSVTLTGTNDAPVAIPITASGNPASTAMLLLANSIDPDLTDTATYTVNTLGTIGLVTNDGNGIFTYNPNGQFATLAPGQTATDSFTYTVDDGHGGTSTATATVSLNSNNVIGSGATMLLTSNAAAATGSIAEQPAVTGSVVTDNATGSIAFADIIPTDTHTATVVAQGLGYVGALTLGTVSESNLTGIVKGSVPWHFAVADGALDFLSAGQVLVQSYNVTIADNHGGTLVQTVTVTITGANDTPVITSLPLTTSVNEHGPAALAFTPTFTDPDLLDQQAFAVNTTGTHGLVTVIQGGQFIYDPNGAFASLNVGQTATDHFTYSVVDNNGAAATQTASITIIGQNDAPVANADSVGPIAAGATSANLWTSLLANDTDVDTAHASLVISSVNTTGTTGSVVLNTATQSLTYHAPAGAGPDTFQYTMSDGQGGTSTATVTVNGDHLVTDSWLVSQGQTATFTAASVLGNDTAFNGGALSLTSVSGPDVTWDGTHITYTAPGSGSSDSFSYTTTDSAGKHATGTVNVALWDGLSATVGSSANQAEWLVAGSSTVSMLGTAGPDHLQGGGGAISITGGAGADTLTGGSAIAANHFVYNYGGAAAPNKDSNVGAMDDITDFLSGLDVIELNGFGFTAASTALITATNIKAAAFTSGDVAGYFADGNVIHVETQKTATAFNNQIYVDANKDGSFEAASDLVIHLDGKTGAAIVTDFTFH
jgi:VCBS repeat-containing protein